MINFLCSLPFFFVFLSVFMIRDGSIETSKPWIYWSFGCVLLASIVSCFVNRKSIRINFSDGLLIIFYFIALSTSYIAPFTNDAKLEYLTLFIVLYFCFRITLVQNNLYKYWFSLFYILTICFFSIYGTLQYYHVVPFRSQEGLISGSFTNHGLYAGFLAIALPLIFDILLRYKSIFKKGKKIKDTVYYKILWIVSALTFFIILFDLSLLHNKAMILSLIGGFTLFIIGTYKNKFFSFIKKNLVLAIFLTLLFLSAITIVSYNLYNKSPESSNIRYKVGLITINTIKENKWGTGIGSFPANYKLKQIEYNKQANSNDELDFVAPYPYNEYLQIAIEYGLLGFICFVLLIFITLSKGFINKNYGYAASLFSLQIFSLMWYPYLFMPFVIVFVFFIATCVSKSNTDKNSNNIIYLVAICTLFLFCVHRGFCREKAKQKFEEMLMDPNDITDEKYNILFSLLKNDEHFLFSYSAFLYNQGLYLKNDSILHRLDFFSSKKEVYLGLSKNNLAQSNDLKAEENLLNSYFLDKSDKKIYYILTDFYLNTNKLNEAQSFMDMIEKTDTISFSFKQLEKRIDTIEKELK